MADDPKTPAPSGDLTEVKVSDTTVVPDAAKGDKFDPSQTAHVLSRKSPEEIQAVFDKLGQLRPDLMAPDPDPKPEPKPDPKPDADKPDAKLTVVEGEIQALKESNWRKDAMLKYGLTPDDAQFITGTTEQKIMSSAYALKTAMAERVKGALSEVGKVPAGMTIDAPILPDPNKPADDPIPIYDGAYVPTYDECKDEFSALLAEKPWANQ